MISPHTRVPVAYQLAAVLRARILNGTYPPGALLPSETRLSQEHGVGRGTVRRAVAELRAEGLVDAASGRGTRVREAADREIVSVPRGALVSARMPTPEERAGWTSRRVPVQVVTLGGRVRGVHPADRVTLRLR